LNPKRRKNGRGIDQEAVGSRRSFWASNEAMEPKDEKIYFWTEERDLYH
jgi:hypothetical protein